MHLLCTGNPWHLLNKFDSLYLRLGCSHSISSTQGQCFCRNKSTYTITEQIIAGGKLAGHRHSICRPPFQRDSGSVATVVFWDRCACELCDAPDDALVHPTRCPLLPRESCSTLASVNGSQQFVRIFPPVAPKVLPGYCTRC